MYIRAAESARRMKQGFRGEQSKRGEERREGGGREKMEEDGYRKEGVGNARRKEEGGLVVVVVRPCGSMKSKATLSPELPPFGNDVFRLPGARGINPICLPPSSRV